MVWKIGKTTELLMLTVASRSACYLFYALKDGSQLVLSSWSYSSGGVERTVLDRTGNAVLEMLIYVEAGEVAG